MKKIKPLIIISLLMLFIPTIMSQNSYYDYYFNVGDTIHGRSPIYHYQWWSENWQCGKEVDCQIAHDVIFEILSSY